RSQKREGPVQPTPAPPFFLPEPTAAGDIDRNVARGKSPPARLPTRWLPPQSRVRSDCPANCPIDQKHRLFECAARKKTGAAAPASSHSGGDDFHGPENPTTCPSVRPASCTPPGAETPTSRGAYDGPRRVRMQDVRTCPL